MAKKTKNDDIFGLEGFGASRGGLSPIWGAVAGVGLQAGGAVAIRAMTDYDEYADLIGAGVGALAGGVMAMFPRSRGAGYTAIFSALLAGGIRFAEQKLSAKEQAKNEVAKNGDALTGLGLATIENVPSLGIATIERTRSFGAADGHPQLVGNRPELVGGPAVSGLANHYGATLFGGR